MSLRNLLGNAKKIEHDPGPEGESGEGDSALVMIFLVIAATIIILAYGESPQNIPFFLTRFPDAFSRSASPFSLFALSRSAEEKDAHDVALFVATRSISFFPFRNELLR